MVVDGRTKGMMPPALHEVSGVIHCHSTYSDGMESIPVIMDCANQAGLDFLLMTDHDTVLPYFEIGEQWHANTLLLLGYEITPRHNHYLVYGVTTPISPHLPPGEYTAAVAEQGGLGFMAHPFEAGSRFLGQNSYTWEDWSVTHYTGMELWNYFSEWVGHCRGVTSTAQALLNWRKVTRGPNPRTLATWDELGQHRRVVGIGGVDAHGIKRRVLGRDIVLHPYVRSFRTVRTHLLLPAPFTRDVPVDRGMMMDALRAGLCYLANHQEGDPSGFTFVARSRGEWALMGQEIHGTEPGEVHFSVRVPYVHTKKPVLRLLKNGEVIAETHDCDLQATDSGPGVYRVEAHRNGRGWIYANPIYLRG